jgi:hypothetical protein
MAVFFYCNKRNIMPRSKNTLLGNVVLEENLHRLTQEYRFQGDSNQ